MRRLLMVLTLCFGSHPGAAEELDWSNCPISGSLENATSPSDDDDIRNPYGPLIPCSFLPDEFVHCDEPISHAGNRTARDELGYGCIKFGGSSRWEEVERTSVLCTALECVECVGNRTFLREGFPCVFYSGHYFLSTLLYSLLLGFLGLDRFCLGHTGIAVGKLMTLGGFGIWWIVDVILLVLGYLTPEDNSSWMPYY